VERPRGPLRHVRRSLLEVETWIATSFPIAETQCCPQDGVCVLSGDPRFPSVLFLGETGARSCVFLVLHKRRDEMRHRPGNPAVRVLLFGYHQQDQWTSIVKVIIDWRPPSMVKCAIGLLVLVQGTVAVIWTSPSQLYQCSYAGKGHSRDVLHECRLPHPRMESQNRSMTTRKESRAF
jgi:hypothetical protein